MTPNTPEPPPAPSTGADVWPLVVKDMEERNRIGTAKYGTPLRTGNGRKALVDAYQEVLDLAVYLRQEIEEREVLDFKVKTIREARDAEKWGNAIHVATCKWVGNAAPFRVDCDCHLRQSQVVQIAVDAL